MSSNRERLVADVAELALACSSPSAFRREFLDVVGKRIGADVGTYILCARDEVRLEVECTINPDTPILRRGMAHWLREVYTD
jgi:hypothetical protein